MKKILPFLILFLIASTINAYAYRRGQSPKSGGYTQDSYGHWTSNSNLNNDSDGDGRSNMYDRSDKNPWR